MGTAITVDAKGKFIVPDDPIIPCIAGDGIGPDIWNAGKPVPRFAVQPFGRYSGLLQNGQSAGIVLAKEIGEARKERCDEF